jgi:transposase
LLVDARGVPLSPVVTGANRHDVSQLEAVLDAMMVERTSPPIRRHKHLCADAGYTGGPALKVIEEHGYIPHVKGRGQEADELKRVPEKKARRRVYGQVLKPRRARPSWPGLRPGTTRAGTIQHWAICRRGLVHRQAPWITPHRPQSIRRPAHAKLKSRNSKVCVQTGQVQL